MEWGFPWTLYLMSHSKECNWNYLEGTTSLAAFREMIGIRAKSCRVHGETQVTLQSRSHIYKAGDIERTYQAVVSWLD